MLNFKHINNITGLRAFAGCFNVTEISFKDNTTITTIPSQGNGRDNVTYATFHSMPKLKTVIFDNSAVATIKGCNFSSCSALETVSFKNCDALTTFEGGCFRNTTLLKTIDMSECPNLATFCNDSAAMSFNDSGLETLILDNTKVVSFQKGQNTYGVKYHFTNCPFKKLSFKNCTELTTINFSGYTRDTLIDLDVTGCTALTTIGSDVFSGATNLEEVTGWDDVKNTLTTIGNSAFKNCTKLNIDLNDMAVLTSIGEYTFQNDPLVTNLNFTNYTTLTNIGKYAFDGCTGITSINFTGCTALTVINEGVFRGCTNISAIDLTPCTALTKIGALVFTNCTSLTSINASNLLLLETVGVYDSSSWVKYSTANVCGGCTSLTSIDFSNCTSLRYLGYYFAQNNTAITTVNLSGCTSFISFGTEAFCNNTNLTTLNLTGCTALQSFGTRSFRLCTSLVTIIDWENLKNNITAFWNGAFNECSSLNIDLSNMPELQYIYNTNNGNTNSRINDGVFTGCTALTTNINNWPKIVTIAQYSFKNCTSLGDIDLHDTTTLTTIGSYAFNNAKITNVNLNGCSNLTNIEAGTFNSSKVVNFTMNDCTSVINLIGGNASTSSFGICSLLETFSAKNCTALTTIGAFAFAKDLKLTSIDFTGCTSLTRINERAFQLQTTNASPRTINFTNCKIRLIDTAAFEGSKNLTLITQVHENESLSLGSYILNATAGTVIWNVIGNNTLPQTKVTSATTAANIEMHFSASAKDLYTAQALLLEDALAGTTALNAWCCSNGESTTTTGGTTGDIICDVNAFYNNKLASISFDL